MFLRGCPDVYLGLAVFVTLEESVDFLSSPLIHFGSNYGDMLATYLEEMRTIIISVKMFCNSSCLIQSANTY